MAYIIASVCIITIIGLLFIGIYHFSGKTGNEGAASSHTKKRPHSYGDIVNSVPVSTQYRKASRIS